MCTALVWLQGFRDTRHSGDSVERALGLKWRRCAPLPLAPNQEVITSKFLYGQSLTLGSLSAVPFIHILVLPELHPPFIVYFVLLRHISACTACGEPSASCPPDNWIHLVTTYCHSHLGLDCELGLWDQLSSEDMIALAGSPLRLRRIIVPNQIFQTPSHVHRYHRGSGRRNWKTKPKDGNSRRALGVSLTIIPVLT